MTHTRPGRRRERQLAAAERRWARAQRSPQEQLRELDRRSERAADERARLAPAAAA